MNDLVPDLRAVARWRLHTLRLSDHTYPTPEAAVGGLLGVQAENHRQASWAVGTRTSGTTEVEFARRFDAGGILRLHVLRPTWHYVCPDDVRWLVELTAPRVSRILAQAARGSGLDRTIFDRAAEAIVDELADGRHLTRRELGDRLAERGLPVEGPHLRWFLVHAELSALVCSGPMHGNEHTYALLEERAPRARRIDRDEALSELALRYFAGHGPATVRDLAYWATMTLTDVRKGLAEVSDQLACFDHDGRTYWYGDGVPDLVAPFHPRAHLLQVLDEYHNGYQDSRDVLDADRIVPTGRGATYGMALVDGQMVGHVRRQVRAHDVAFEVGLFRDVDDGEEQALRAAADRHGTFVGLAAELVMHRVR